MKIIRVIFQWLLIIGVAFAIWFYWGKVKIPTLQGYQVLFFALSIAFTNIEVLKLGSVKPFNCLKCLTGWLSLILAFIFHTQFWYLYLPAGFFVGALFTALKNRWL